MLNRLSRVFLASVLLGALAAAPAMAQNGRGQSRAPELPDAASSGAGVPQAGETVVLRPSGPVPDQYIVVLRDDVTNPRGLANALARQNGLALRGVYTRALKGFAARMPEAVAQRLALDPAVAYIEQDLYAQADVLQVPPVTGVDRIDADENAIANIDNTDGATGVERVDVDVAVIDTGIHPHPELNVYRFYNCIGGCGAKGNFDSPIDDNGHGTHVAGTIGAFDGGQTVSGYDVVGVAPGARLWGFKVLDSGGSGSFADVIAAIDRVTEHAPDIEVSNLSLSGVGRLDSLRTAIQNSVAAGVVYVVAAGNAQQDVYGNNGELDTSANCRGPFCFNADDVIPAAYPEVMTVSALADFDGVSGGLTDQTVAFSSCTHEGDDVFACFTNFSGSVDGSNPVNSPGAAIDVAGPGVLIWSTWPNDSYARISGTSMASPHVAGAVALEIAANGRANDAAGVYAIRQTMIDGAQPQGDWGPADTKDPDANPEGLVYVGVGGDALDGNTAPTVTISSPADGADFNSGAVISFAGMANDTEDGDITTSLVWTSDLDDQIGTGGNFSATLTVGTHVITATVTDSGSADGTDTITITVGQPPTVTISGPMDGASYDEGTSIPFEGSASDAEEGDISADLVWTSDLDGQIGTGGSFNSTLSAGSHTITAMVTDQDGLSDSASITVSVHAIGGGALIVDSVCYFGEGGRTSDKHLNSAITITNDSGGPVGGVTVDATLTNTNETLSGTGTTDSNGEVVFAWKNAASDTYTTTVNAIDGVELDPVHTDTGIGWPPDGTEPNLCS